MYPSEQAEQYDAVPEQAVQPVLQVNVHVCRLDVEDIGIKW